MDRQFQLCGSVKPYFGRSTKPGALPIRAAVMASRVPALKEPFDNGAAPTITPRDLLRQAARMRGWAIDENEDSFDVTVSINAQRNQTVSVDFSRHDPTGHPLMVLVSRCGPAKHINTLALLRRNFRLLQSAFAVQKTGAEELTVLRGSLRADNSNAEDVAQMIESIASYADRVERKLVGTDEF